MRLVLLGLFAAPLLLFACTASLRPAAPSRQMIDPHLLRSRLTLLPGAEVSAGNPPVVRYPGDSLFASGAALPLPGGTAVLDPLAEILASVPHLRWRGTVRAETEISREYDHALAEKRAELLARYFAGRGIAPEQLSLIPEGAAGAPLELVPELDQPASSANSSRGKK